MSTTTTKKIPVAQIATKWTINGRPGSAIFSSWIDARHGLASLASPQRDSAGVDVTGIAGISILYAITWADGFRAEGTYEGKKGIGPDIAGSIKYVWLYYAGLWKPDEMSDRIHDAAMAKNPKRRDEATRALTIYALDDEPSVKATETGSMSLPSPDVSSNDLVLVNEYVSRLIQRIEQQPNYNKPLSMELRKALAAIIRAQQIQRA